MSIISRREILQTTAKAAGLWGIASQIAPLSANPLGLPIGCQTYPVRAMMAHDIPGTLKKLSDAGFQAIELCSPVGYADAGFAGIGKYKGAELRKMLADLGLFCESSHFDINELRKDLPGRIAWANDIGIKQMIVPSLDGPKHPTLDDVKRAADEYNKIAQQSADAGLQQGFAAAKTGGVKNYFVEMKLDLMKESVPYLRSLQV
jgi:sugar phosphate isomerase/epimerase